jgi:hypothetical protein
MIAEVLLQKQKSFGQNILFPLGKYGKYAGNGERANWPSCKTIRFCIADWTPNCFPFLLVVRNLPRNTKLLCRPATIQLWGPRDHQTDVSEQMSTIIPSRLNCDSEGSFITIGRTLGT